MQIRGLVLCAAVLLSAAAPASAAMRIADDRGGQIGQYLQAFTLLRSTGENVVIDGNCLSACTLVLGMIPSNKICATENARFGFHAAWMPDQDGRPVTSTMGTRALWNIYPASVRHWINHHGGLSRHMIFLEGSALHGIVRSCSATPRVQARSHRRDIARRTYRYASGSAASDRR
ncbi:MAG TPA: hypothetical protein VFA57_03975 [Pseudolabrys sp.]|jgi:hypothetical protein|nr:hypothetical protein [Pseudolabrys sp.]